MGIKFLGKMFKPLIKKMVKRELQSDANKIMLVNLVNDKVDIPKMTEKEEDKLFKQLYDVLGEHILLVIDRI
jgi:hypothetical protein